jgi:glutathione peroxidase
MKLLNSNHLSAAVGLVFLCGSTMALSSTCTPVLDHQLNNLKGDAANLCQYSGKVVLVVNTASQCGYTPQYEGLQKVYDKYREKGLVIVGVPSNDFGKQEPGSNAEVAEFCERLFKVKFPMLEKASVSAPAANPLHEALAKSTGQRPKWNFHKYLISRDGKEVLSFPSNVAPTSEELDKNLNRLLSAK